MSTQWLSQENYALFLLAISAMSYSTMGLFIQLCGEEGIPSTQLVFMRTLFQTPIVIVAMFFYTENEEAEPTNSNNTSDNTTNNTTAPKISGQRLIWVPLGRSKRNRKVLLMRGVVGSIGFIFYYYTIKSIPLGDAVTLLSLTPIMTIFLARIFLGEPIRMIQVLATLLCALGAICITGGTSGLLSNISKDDENGTSLSDLSPYYNEMGYVTGIIGSFLGAAVFVLVRSAGKLGAHTLQLLLSWCIFGFIISIIVGILDSTSSFQVFHENPWFLPPFSSVVWWYILGLCTFGTTSHFLLNYAARLSRAGLTSIVRASDIMWAYIFEVIVFHQRPTVSTRIGVFFILCSLMLVTWEKLNEMKHTKYVQVVDADKDENDTKVKSNMKVYGSFTSLNAISV